MANGTVVGIDEARLWSMADALRSNMDAAEYKHVVLGLIFLKYISDAFEARYEYLRAAVNDSQNDYFLRADLPGRSLAIESLLEDKDEYKSQSIFWVPKEARWSYLRASAPQPTIGTIVDDAMTAIERDNPSLKGVLPKDCARPGLDKQRLGQLINLVSDVGLGNPANRAKDVLGKVFEYFLQQFASAEGKKGGQFYTPSHVVRILVEMLAPYKGRVYDPCCGSGGMFVSSEKFIEAHSGRIGDISIYGQESNYTTWRLAKMNLAIRGIDAQIAHGDTFHNDRNPDLKADWVMANPPFNDSDWRGELLKEDKRWVYGIPPASNANFAWVQHFIYHLAPTGIAGFVLANGSMSSDQSGEGEIRRNIIEADLVDCMVALPGQLFYGIGDLSVYELIMSRQVDVASGCLCERKEFSRRIRPLRSAKRRLKRAPSIYYRLGYAVLSGIVHRMLPWHPATQALDSTVTFLNTTDCWTRRLGAPGAPYPDTDFWTASTRVRPPMRMPLEDLVEQSAAGAFHILIGKIFQLMKSLRRTGA